MKIKAIGLIFSLVLANLASAVNAVEPVKESSQARELAFLAAPIKNAADLQSYLEMTQGRYSPLNKLPKDDRDRFLQSITWNERGVTGFSAVSFQNSSATEAFQILALFGIQHVTPLVRPAVRSLTDKVILSQKEDGGATTLGEGGPEKDYEGYRCSARATCSSSPGDVCTSNC
jgi:hypothetical protein